MTCRVPPAAAFLFLLCFSHSAFAEAGRLRLGQMELAYDAHRWRAEASALSDVTLRPIGELARELDPVRLNAVPVEGPADCEGHARDALTGEIYEGAHATAVAVAGVDAVRLSAWTRCRNAMPHAVAICVAHEGLGYLFVVRQHSCQGGGNNLFSGIDPLAELLEGVRFVP